MYRPSVRYVGSSSESTLKVIGKGKSGHRRSQVISTTL